MIWLIEAEFVMEDGVTLNGKPVWKNVEGLYLFYAGHWKIETKTNYDQASFGSNTHIGFLKAEVDSVCPGGWWKKDETDQNVIRKLF